MSKAGASYQPVVVTECSVRASNNSSESFLVYPIRFKLPKKQKLTLFFTSQASSKICMD